MIALCISPRLRAAAAICLLTILTTGAAVAQDQPAPADALARVAERLERAENLGARRDLPGAYREIEKRLEAARRDGATVEATAALELDVRRLVNRAAFVKEMHSSRSPLEAIANRLDGMIGEVATIQGLDLDPGLSGAEAAARLLEMLAQERHSQQILVDSLRVELAKHQTMSGGRLAAQDSIITTQRVEISDLRRKLWSTELRAGVAEADRSAAESALTRRQQEEQAVKEIGADLGATAGNVLVSADGEITLQVFGLVFGVGSAQLKPGQDALIAKLAAAIERFAGAEVRVEGHTDDTGRRENNLDLSQQRAGVVARALAQRLGREPASITTVGYGPDRPIAPNSTDQGRARNRRIDVVIIPAR